VFPRLFAYVCDFPESAKVTCTYSGVNSARPCSLCEVERAELANPYAVMTPRTEDKQHDLFLDMQEARTNAQREEIKKKWSIHNVQVAYIDIVLTLF
jgi:Plavaka transposase